MQKKLVARPQRAVQSAEGMRILLLNAHQDEGSHCVALWDIRFDLMLRGGYHAAKPWSHQQTCRPKTNQGIGVTQICNPHPGSGLTQLN